MWGPHWHTWYREGPADYVGIYLTRAQRGTGGSNKVLRGYIGLSLQEAWVSRPGEVSKQRRMAIQEAVYWRRITALDLARLGRKEIPRDDGSDQAALPLTPAVVKGPWPLCSVADSPCCLHFSFRVWIPWSTGSPMRAGMGLFIGWYSPARSTDLEQQFFDGCMK